MGKYIGYALIVLVILFALEWLEIVDVPLLEIPDLTSSKKAIIEKSEDNMRRRFGDLRHIFRAERLCCLIF